jgi:16S rRNA processing protein RimM
VIRNNEKLGTITDVISYPANDVYIIKNTGGKEILLPAINDLIISFDSTKKVMILKPGGELYEDED